MAEIKNSIIAGLVFGLVNVVFFVFIYGIEYPLITGGLSGLLFGLAIYFFMTSKQVKRQTQIDVEAGNEIILTSGANHFKNKEAVGGKLYLLADRLQFKSHGLNIQNHELKIGIEEIDEIQFFNTLGLVPNGLAIQLANGQIEKFVVNGRKRWREEIERIIKSAYRVV